MNINMGNDELLKRVENVENNIEYCSAYKASLRIYNNIIKIRIGTMNIREKSKNIKLIKE